MRWPALRAFRANPVGSGFLGIDQCAADNERGLAFHDDEIVTRLLVDFNLAGSATLSQDSQTAFVFDDRSAFRHGGGDLIVWNVCDSRRHSRRKNQTG